MPEFDSGTFQFEKIYDSFGIIHIAEYASAKKLNWIEHVQKQEKETLNSFQSLCESLFTDAIDTARTDNYIKRIVICCSIRPFK